MTSPFDDLRLVLSQLPEGDNCAANKISANDEYAAVDGEDGLYALKRWLGVWQGTSEPSVKETHICVLASCYAGHDNKNVSAFITDASRGRAPVNRLCVDGGIGLRVLELAPDLPYDTNTPWEQADCMAAVAFGMEATAAGGHLLALSEMAPGNLFSALAIIVSLGADYPRVTLRKYENQIQTKDEDIQKVFSELNDLFENEKSAKNDPLETLRFYGGREIAASVGAIVAARSRRLPVIIDGWSALTAMVLLEAECPGSTDHVEVAAVPDPLAEHVLAELNRKALVGFHVKSGPGCGNAVSVGLLKAACDL